MLLKSVYLTVIAVLLLSACQSLPLDTPTPAVLFKPEDLTDTPGIPTAELSQTTASNASKPGCTVVADQVSSSDQDSIVPLPTERDWILGPDEAYVTLVEYGDFQCPGCAGIAPVLARLLEEYPQDLRLVYRHFPLISIHNKAAQATQASEAAGKQGKFWEMHDLLFQEQSVWSALSEEEFTSWLIERAAEMGIDQEAFRADLNKAEIVESARKSWDDGVALGLPGTPTLVINGKPFSAQLSYGNLKAIIDTVLLEQRQFTECPPMTIDPTKKYRAVLKTEKGDIVIELFADKSPLAVNNFIFLARHGWYDGITFHRVIPGFVAQTGDPSGSGFGSPGFGFDNEISPDLKFDAPGIVGMANAGPGSNGSQFFITYDAAPHLDGGYTIFGRVISGMDVIEKLTPRDPSQGLGLPPGDLLNTVIIEESP